MPKSNKKATGIFADYAVRFVGLGLLRLWSRALSFWEGNLASSLGFRFFASRDPFSPLTTVFRRKANKFGVVI
jgi:hypothetical protein